MKKLDIINKIKEGYKVQVVLQPTKKHDKLTLKTWLRSDKTNTVYSVYYNHCKEFLSNEQLRLIDLYNDVKNYSFRDKVDLNILSKTNTVNKEAMEKIVMLRSINKIEYLELI